MFQLKGTSTLKNCLSCKLYLKCKDPLKSVIYQCDSYKRAKGDDGMLRLFDAAGAEMPNALSVRSKVPDIALPGSLDGFDIYQTIKEAVGSDAIVSPDIKIPDGDFPLAKNFLDFCGPKFLNTKPYVSQALIGIRLFAEYCPRCSDVDYFDNYGVADTLTKLQKKICLLEHGVCPSCKMTKSKAISKGILQSYNEVAISAGQRSGKSAMTGMFTAYQTHCLLKLQNPNEVYRLMKSNVLHGTFVALTYAQAKDTLWEPFYGNILESPWFGEYHSMLSEHHERTGEELHKLNDTFVLYRHRRMLIYPAGPDKRTLRGRTRIFGSIDELGWFDNTADSSKVKLSANEVYIALERSLLTVRAAATRLHKQGFTNAPTAYFYNVSSPSSARDKIMELVRKAQTSRNILGLIRPTWEMNPGVTRADLEDEFRKDPATAMRDYGAQPPLSSNAFLSEALVDGVIGEHKNAVVLNHQIKKSKKTGEMTRHAIISKVRRTGKASVLALDAGFVNNSFALALGHLKDHKFPMLDALIEVQAMPGVKINFSRVYRNVIEPLIEARNVKLVAADRWNSIKILSDLEEDHGVLTQQYSLKYADMRLFKDYIEDKQIILPDPGRELSEIIKYDHHEYPANFKNDPLGHFYLQMQTVQDTGSSVIKGDQLTDDMVRAAMLATRMLLDEDHQELFQQDQEEVRPFVDISKQAVYKGYSGGGGSSTPGAAGGQNALGVRKSRG